jgi:hypothetical protein
MIADTFVFTLGFYERFGPDPDHREVYEQLTGDMQQALTGLADERTAPILG